MKEVYALDWDNVTYHPRGKFPMLVEFSEDWVSSLKKTNHSEYSHFNRMGLLLKFGMVGVKLLTHLLGKYHKTGESQILKFYEDVFLEDAGIPLEFMKKQAEKYSSQVDTFFAAYASNSDNNKNLAIITAEPTQFVESVLSYLNIDIPVHGNNFEIEDNAIIGFERGVRGGYRKKRDCLIELIENGAEKIYYLDDKTSNLFNNLNRVESYAFQHNFLSVNKIKEVVPPYRNNKEIHYVKDLKEFLTN